MLIVWSNNFYNYDFLYYNRFNFSIIVEKNLENQDEVDKEVIWSYIVRVHIKKPIFTDEQFKALPEIQTIIQQYLKILIQFNWI